jgi:hypothetical protein
MNQSDTLGDYLATIVCGVLELFELNVTNACVG